MRGLRKQDRVPSLDVLEMAMERGYGDGTQYPHTTSTSTTAGTATCVPTASHLERPFPARPYSRGSSKWLDSRRNLIKALLYTPLIPLPNEHDFRSANRS